MQQITLDPNNWVFRLQRYVYGYDSDDLEQDGCKLGWQLIFLPFYLIIAWPSILMKFYLKESISKYSNEIGYSLVMTLVGFLLLFIAYDGAKVSFIGEIPRLLLYPASILMLALFAAFIGLIVLISFVVAKPFEYIKDKISTRFNKKGKVYKPKQETFLKTWLKAKKEKSCPKINWNE